MRYRTLGRRGPEVSVIGFGAMTLATGIYADVAEDEAAEALRAAVDAGVTFVDTADIYGPGASERLVGRVLGPRRDGIVLATKFGGDHDEEGRLVRGLGRPGYVRRALEASLTRLGTDHVDLYYLHRLDPTTPVEDTVGALAEQVAAGKIGHIGLSEVSAATLRRAHAVHPITAVQSEYSLLTRDPEDGVLAACAELGVGFVAYSPLGRGLLGGAVRSREDMGGGDWRRGNPRFQGDNLTRNVTLADTLATLAAGQDVTAAQLALAWLLRKGAFPIPGTRRAAKARANAAAADLDLPAAVFEELEARIPRDAVAGPQGDRNYLTNIDR
ncbi:aldo/keto reductase [Actinomadura kijaniata]|uniref:Aryl-alcohol dehydrogenase-like predicted oxidoreductase n=1 Tax=Actinomadura namibiensis TaxID=182080 RepID=A0A7W3LMJ8_ACTNM|nr:aldo/keto reductase [Actinomadura namibiensis]MBA8950873.1 aryl-alcohol dehydrogenase-like predicted oxidoreductase [Actinomadura namibiensis]